MAKKNSKSTERKPRTDAQRNRERILEVAKEIHRKHAGIVVACDDLYGRFNRRQELTELWQLRLVGTKKAYGFDKTVPLVRAQEVLSHVIGKFISFNKCKNRLDTLTRIHFAKWLKSRHVDDVFQHPVYLYGNGRGAVADDNAAKKARMSRRREQKRGSTNVRANRMRLLEPKCVN